IPPDAVTNLAVSSTGGSTVQLTWTAPGDDGSIGRAANYDVRYSTTPIDANNFASATRALSPPDPQPAGATEQMTVSGLAFSTTYYFALRTSDELGGASPMSNVVVTTTLGAPHIV